LFALLRSLSLIALGILIAGALLYGYSRLFNTPSQKDDSLRYVPVRPGDAVISLISGEVYIIREDKMITPRAGDAVREGDVIKVVDDSWCQVHISGKATMNIRSNTLLKVQRLLTGTRDIDIRTELLTGSMIYKVDRLESTDNLEVLAQRKIYRVEGTEFIVAASSAGSRVAVREGHVAVLLEDQDQSPLELVPAGKSLDLRGWEDGTPLPESGEIGLRDRRIFEEETPNLGSYEQELVYLEISSEPEGAQIYLDGRLSGRRGLSGLFSADEELVVLARKRGYQDVSLKITPRNLRSSRIVLKLFPLSLEDSLKNEADRDPETSMEELQARFEEAEDLNSSFRDQIRQSETRLEELNNLSRTLKRDLDNMEGDNSSLRQEKKKLEKELEASIQEQEKLRNLLIEIQKLSTEQ
jgi:hypothetical protein